MSATSKKLFEVDIQLKLYVLAEDRQEAYKNALGYASEEVLTSGIALVSGPVTEPQNLEGNWAQALPYGLSPDEVEETCKQIVERQSVSGRG